MTQLSLFDCVPLTAEERFQQFHQAHPEVLDEMLKRARLVKDRGFDRYSIKTLFEIVRWHFTFERDPTDEFKLNNNYHSRYARLLMERYPGEFGKFFETRELRS